MAQRGNVGERRAHHGQLVIVATGLLLVGSACAATVDTSSATSFAPSTATPASSVADTTSSTFTPTPSTSTSRSTSEPVTPSTSGSTTGSTTESTTGSTTGAPPSSTATTTTLPTVGGFDCPPGDQPPAIWEQRPPSDLARQDVPAEWTRAVLGRSVQGRPIEAFVRTAEEPHRRVVVIGGVHGNEPVTPPSVRGLIEAEVPTGVEVWLVPTANPDGSAAGVRCNAHGVDLNRNFSWEWRPDDGGPGPMSEPETQAMAAVVEGLGPDLVVWVHQPLDYVSAIGPTAPELEEAWAGASGLPVRPDVTQHGGGESWSAFVAGVPSMLIEIDGWEATPEIVAAQRAGFEATLLALG